jgi:hypothetical protein
MSQTATSHSRSLKLSTNGLKLLRPLTSHSRRLTLFIVGWNPLLLQVTPPLILTPSRPDHHGGLD